MTHRPPGPPCRTLGRAPGDLLADLWISRVERLQVGARAVIHRESGPVRVEILSVSREGEPAAGVSLAQLISATTRLVFTVRVLDTGATFTAPTMALHPTH